MGVVVPEAYQYDRPVPRGQTATQGYQVAEAPELTNASANATMAQARAFTETGAEVAKWGERLEVTMAQDAVNQLKSKRSDMTVGDDGFLKVRGGDVLKPGPDGQPIFKSYPQRFESQVEMIGSKLLSPRARQIYNDRAAQEIIAYKADVARHGLSESEKYEASVFKNTQTRLQNDGAKAADDPQALDQFAEQAYVSTLARTKNLGLEGEEIAKGARSDVYRIALESKIRSGDESAIGMYDRIKDKLDGKDVAAIEQSIKTLRTSSVARTQAQSFTDPSYDGRTRSYESGAMEFNKLGSGAFGPYQFMPGTWADVRKANADLNLPADMTKATREQHDAAHDRFKAGNAASLKADGLEATPANLYLAHRFGAKGAASVLKANANAPLSSVLPPEWQAQNPDMKGQTAGSFRALAERRYAGVTDTGIKSDPLTASVNQATGVEPPKNGPLYRDTRQMLLDADIAYDAATRRNMEVNATDEAQRRATQSQIDLNLATQKRQIEMAKLNLEISVDKWMTTGGVGGTSATQRPPPEIWNQLPYEKQRSIDATIAHNAKGTDAITDQQTWYAIQQGLTSEDPAVRGEWANKPLWEFKSKLSNQDFQELAKMQGTAKKGDPEKNLTHVRNINQMVDDTLLKLKIDTTPKPGSTDADRAQRFRRVVQDEISVFEGQKGKKATPEEQQKIIDKLAVTTASGGWFSRDKRAFEMPVKDVPAAERQKITDALKRQGVTATDALIIEVWGLKNGKAAK